MNKTRIAVIGLGGVGGYFGFKLAQTYSANPAVEITFVARGETYAVVAEKGLTLLSPEHEDSTSRPDKLVVDVSQLQGQDVYMLCVKEYDLEQLCESLKAHISAQTILLPLMNGADIYARIRKIIPKGIVLPACVYVASHIKEKGVVEHKGKAGKIFMGPDPEHAATAPKEVYNLLKGAGIDVTLSENVVADIWTKYLFIASFGLVSACYNASIGQVLDTPALKAQAAAIMEEIVAIAGKKGVSLPEGSIDETFRKAAAFPYHTPTSLQLDVQAKKAYNELDLFAGTIIRYGRELGIPVVATERIYQQILENLDPNSQPALVG